MHRLTPISIVLAVLLVALPATAEAASSRTITLKARSTLDRAQSVDAAPAGASAGDMLIFTERLFDARGRKIGSDAATCVRLFDESSLCSGIYTLRTGTLMVQLHQPGLTGTRTYDQAIVGGTGRFEGARGRVRVAQRPNGDRFTFKIRVDG